MSYFRQISPSPHLTPPDIICAQTKAGACSSFHFLNRRIDLLYGHAAPVALPATTKVTALVCVGRSSSTNAFKPLIFVVGISFELLSNIAKVKASGVVASPLAVAATLKLSTLPGVKENRTSVKKAESESATPVTKGIEATSCHTRLRERKKCQALRTRSTCSARGRNSWCSEGTVSEARQSSETSSAPPASAYT